MLQAHLLWAVPRLGLRTPPQGSRVLARGLVLTLSPTALCVSSNIAEEQPVVRQKLEAAEAARFAHRRSLKGA